MTDYLSYTAVKNILSRIPSYIGKTVGGDHALFGIEEGVFYGYTKQWDVLINPPVLEKNEKPSKDTIFYVETIKKTEKVLVASKYRRILLFKFNAFSEIAQIIPNVYYITSNSYEEFFPATYGYLISKNATRMYIRLHSYDLDVVVHEENLKYALSYRGKEEMILFNSIEEGLTFLRENDLVQFTSEGTPTPKTKVKHYNYDDDDDDED